MLPERAWQATLGAEVRPLPGVFASAETFYKRLSDLIVRTPAVETVGGVARTQILDNAGTGRVLGLEVLLRKELSERLFGWVAYTLSRSDRIDRPGQRRRLFDFDRTHNLTAVASYRLGNDWQVGARYRIISGNPDTPVLGSRYLANFDAYLPIYGPINSQRLPTFHQIDVRVDRTWIFDAWMLDAYDFSQHAYFQGLPVVPTLGLAAPKDDPSKKYGYSFFTTAGTISSLRSTDITATGQPAPIWVDWTAPDRAQEVRLWVVLRDGRGGTAWLTRVVPVR